MLTKEGPKKGKGNNEREGINHRSYHCLELMPDLADVQGVTRVVDALKRWGGLVQGKCVGQHLRVFLGDDHVRHVLDPLPHLFSRLVNIVKS